MPRLVVLLFLLLALEMTAPFSGVTRDGYVRSRDGGLWTGRVRCESNAVFVVDLERELWVSVPWTNVQSVGLGRESGGGAASGDWGAPAPGVGWRAVDIGAVLEAGVATPWAGGFRMRSAGTNAFGTADSQLYVFKDVRGDTEIVGRVASVENSHPLAQAGLSVRESLAADARQATLMVTARRGALFGVRRAPGEAATLEGGGPARAPYWLKLSRHGDVISAFLSSDGRNWASAGRVRMRLPDDILVGVGAVGIREGVPAHAVVERLREAPSLGGPGAPRIRLTGGSVQQGEIVAMDDTVIRLGFVDGAPLPVRAVANIQFRAVPQRHSKRLITGEPGVLLASGEFVAGDIHGLRHGQVTVSSIPLGLLTYDAGAELMAVIFRRQGPVMRAPCRLTTVAGSMWLATAMVVEGDWVVLRDPAYGVRRIPTHEVIEMEWIAAR